MQALVLREWWNLAVEEVATPVASAYEVLIAVLATGICGSDLHGYTGENGRRVPGQVMGHETVGRVAAIGPTHTATDLSIGDVVTVNPVIWCGHCPACLEGMEQACVNKSVIGVTPSIVSAFAEYLVVPVRNVVRLNTGIEPELGALVEPLSVGYHAARRGGVSAQTAVMVIGGGPIGQAAVLGAQRLGATAIVVSEPNAGRRQLMTELDTAVIDPVGDDDLASTVEKIIGRRPDVVIDAVGSTISLSNALECARPSGVVVLVGMGEPQPVLPAYAVSTAERTVIGSFCYTALEFRETADWLAVTDKPLARLIQGRVNLDGGSLAFDQLARGQSAATKVLVFPGGGV